MEINLAGVVGESITDGPGIRTAIFCQGCPHHCEGCHNPETWDFTEKNRLSTDALFRQIQADPMVTGVTFSGGEPFSQAEAFAELGEKCRAAGYEVASYSGWTFEQLLALGERKPAVLRLLKTLDVLVDGPFILARRSLGLRFKGSSNQRTLDVPRSLACGFAVLREDGRWSVGADEIPPVQIHYDF